MDSLIHFWRTLLIQIKAYLRRIFVCGGGKEGLDLSCLDLEVLPAGAVAAGAAAGVHRLSLRNNRLAALPSVLEELEGLRSIDLRDNQLAGLPEVLLSLTGLGELRLEGNPLSELPHEVLAQPAAIILDFARRVRAARATASMGLAGLGLLMVPDAAMAAVGLAELVLDDNRLTCLPDALCWALPSLTRLSARRNQLAGALPIRIGLMTALTSLDVAQNRLHSLPPGIALLTRLRILSTASNPVSPRHQMHVSTPCTFHCTKVDGENVSLKFECVFRV
jgi:leucine-rich repeat protein SHOC2